MCYVLQRNSNAIPISKEHKHWKFNIHVQAALPLRLGGLELWMPAECPFWRNTYSNSMISFLKFLSVLIILGMLFILRMSVSYRNWGKAGNSAKSSASPMWSMIFSAKSLPSVAQSSWEVRTWFSWKWCRTTIGLITHRGLKRLLWASWKANQHLFQVLNNGNASKLFNYQPTIIWRTAHTQLIPK